nr:MAG TPA: hypothetical protein [Caudoviricetes sp.]
MYCEHMILFVEVLKSFGYVSAAFGIREVLETFLKRCSNRGVYRLIVKSFLRCDILFNVTSDVRLHDPELTELFGVCNLSFCSLCDFGEVVLFDVLDCLFFVALRSSHFCKHFIFLLIFDLFYSLAVIILYHRFGGLSIGFYKFLLIFLIYFCVYRQNRNKKRRLLKPSLLILLDYALIVPCDLILARVLIVEKGVSHFSVVVDRVDVKIFCDLVVI